MKNQTTQTAMSHISKTIRLLLLVTMMFFAGRAMAQPGEALNFDGVDDYISLPDTAVYGGPGWSELTIEAWINNTGSTNGSQSIVSSDGDNFVNLNTADIGYTF